MIDTPNKNYLSNDVVIKGSIKFANEFIFDGNLEGDIISADVMFYTMERKRDYFFVVSFQICLSRWLY